MEKRILIIDPDVAFATMLKEGLEASAGYETTVVHTGTDGLQSIIEQKQPFSLVILDMGVRDIRPGTLVRAIREARPNMRVMLIPLFGQALPGSAQALNIQGVLPKPFFMGELPAMIEAALKLEVGQAVPKTAPVAAPTEPEPAQENSLEIVIESLPEQASPAMPDPLLEEVLPVSPPEPPPVAVRKVEPPPVVEPAPRPSRAVEPPSVSPSLPPFPQADALRRKVKDVARLLDDLNREVRAEAILVTSGGELIAYTGVLSRERSVELAALVAEEAQASTRVARFLGEPEGRFEQSLQQGSEYTMFSLSPAEGLVISLALSSATPLGILRYNALRTGKALLKLSGL